MQLPTDQPYLFARSSQLIQLRLVKAHLFVAFSCALGKCCKVCLLTGVDGLAIGCRLDSSATGMTASVATVNFAAEVAPRQVGRLQSHQGHKQLGLQHECQMNPMVRDRI